MDEWGINIGRKEGRKERNYGANYPAAAAAAAAPIEGGKLDDREKLIVCALPLLSVSYFCSFSQGLSLVWKGGCIN